MFPCAGTRRDVGGGGTATEASAAREAFSPRHVPDRFVVVEAIPRTLNGKKCEVPVKRILAGVEPEHAVSRVDALQRSGLAGHLRPDGSSLTRPGLRWCWGVRGHC